MNDEFLLSNTVLRVRGGKIAPTLIISIKAAGGLKLISKLDETSNKSIIIRYFVCRL